MRIEGLKCREEQVKIMGIKLVASDLDGTLFTDEKTISDETRRTL